MDARSRRRRSRLLLIPMLDFAPWLSVEKSLYPLRGCAMTLNKPGFDSLGTH
jgi:hypothetical protein